MEMEFEGQLEHCANATPEYVFSGQSKHTLDPEPEYFPEKQFWHTHGATPGTVFEKVPESQSVQAD